MPYHTFYNFIKHQSLKALLKQFITQNSIRIQDFALKILDKSLVYLTTVITRRLTGPNWYGPQNP